MPSPSTSLATLRPELGSFMEFDLEADRAGFIGSRALPVLEVAKQSGPFGKMQIAELLENRETLRAPGAGYSRGESDFTTDTFSCVEHGAEEPVDDRESEMYRDYFNAEVISALRARDVVLRNAEKRVADLLFNTTTWTPTSITNEWDDATNAVPLTDVETAVQKVYGNTGIWPNALIINRKVFRNLRNVTQLIDRIKYQGFVDVRAETITVQAMAQAFDLRFLLVAGGSKNTAAEGAAATLAPIWSDEYAMVCRIATSQDVREAAIGRLFHWGADGSSIGGTIESYRDEPKRSNIIRVRHDVDEKVLYVNLGELLDNVTT